MRIARLMLSILGIVIAILILLIGSIIFLLNTESGTQLSLKVASQLLPGKLSVTQVNGTLLHRLVIKNLQYQDKDLEIVVSDLTFQWQPTALLKKKLRIDELQADQINIVTDTKVKATTEQSDWPKFWRLPLPIRINQLAVNKITVQYSKDTAPIKIQNIHFSASVSPQKIKINLQAKMISPERVQLNFAVNGSLQNYIANLSIKSRYLEREFIGKGDQDSFNFHSVTNQSNRNDFTINGQLNRDPKDLKRWLLQLSIDHFNLATFNPFLPATITLDGKIALNLLVRNLSSEDQIIDFKLQTTPGHFSYQTDDQPLTINFSKSSLALQANQHGLSAHLQFNLTQFAPIIADIKLPGFHQFEMPKPSQKLRGTLTWQINNVAQLPVAIPYVQNLKGQLLINAKLQGTLAKPRVIGTIQIQNGSFRLKEQNIVINNIVATAKADNLRWTYHASANSGGGNLNLTGQSILIGKQINSELRIIGNNFQVSNTQELKLTLSPTLTIVQKNQTINTSGKIIVPYARIWPQDYSEVVTLPADVTLVEATPKQQKTSPWVLNSSIDLVVGKDALLNYKGLTGQLQGELRIIDKPQAAPLANGRLFLVKGKYNIYGQTLTIRQGELLFTNSPIDNPSLNVQAIHTINIEPSSTLTTLGTQKLIVGVNAQGKLDNPQISLFSEPSGLSQADILSYLILGYPSSQANQAGLQLLFRAASALNPGGSASGAGTLMQQLRNSLGLSELDIQSTQNQSTMAQNTSLVLGKYLSPRLYMSYSLGLLGSGNILRLRYMLSKHWSVQTQSSTLGNGADVLYTYERK